MINELFYHRTNLMTREKKKKYQNSITQHALTSNKNTCNYTNIPLPKKKNNPVIVYEKKK